MPGSARNTGFYIDPDLYQFTEEQELTNDALREATKSLPPPGSVPAEKLRNFRLHNKDGSLKPHLVEEAFDEELEVPGLSVLTRVFPVDRPEGVIAHFHGGGWALGSVYEQDAYLWQLAQRTRKKVISIDYPLVPKHELGEILSVATKALAALISSYPDMPFFLAGESAGANVALNSLLRLRKKKDLFQQIRAASFCYGIYDLSMTPSQRNWGADPLGLSTPWLEWFYSQVLPNCSREDRSHPDYSPMYADLSGLPPALFTIGELDPLLDDTLFLFQKWLAEGNKGDLCVYPKAPHGFNGLSTKMADQCNLAISRFLSAGLG
nr:alpha/beta hydrolase fold domain-containing protein [uncultured Hyphomonas sp.]